MQSKQQQDPGYEPALDEDDYLEDGDGQVSYWWNPETGDITGEPTDGSIEVYLVEEHHEDDDGREWTDDYWVNATTSEPIHEHRRRAQWLQDCYAAVVSAPHRRHRIAELEAEGHSDRAGWETVQLKLERRRYKRDLELRREWQDWRFSRGVEGKASPKHRIPTPAVRSRGDRRLHCGRPAAPARRARVSTPSRGDPDEDSEPGPSSGRPLLLLVHPRYGRVSRPLARFLEERRI